MSENGEEDAYADEQGEREENEEDADADEPEDRPGRPHALCKSACGALKYSSKRHRNWRGFRYRRGVSARIREGAHGDERGVVGYSNTVWRGQEH